MPRELHQRLPVEFIKAFGSDNISLNRAQRYRHSTPGPALLRRPVSVYFPLVLVAMFALWPMLTLPALAQSGIGIAPSLGYEFGAPLLLRRDSGKVNSLGVDGSGVSQSHTFWIGAQLHHDSLLGNGWRLSLGGAVAPSVSSFTSSPFPLSIVDSTNASLIPTTRQFTVHGTSALAQISAQAGVPIGGANRLTMGLWGTWQFAADVAATEAILFPDSITFPNGQRSRSVPLLPDAISPPIHAGIQAALEFNVPIGYGLLLAPTFGLRCDATAIASGLGLRSFSSAVGFSVASLASPPPPASQPPPQLSPAAVPAAPPPAPASRINARVGLFASIDGQRLDVAQVVPYRVHYRCAMPLLPAVFFQHGDVRLPAHYRTISAAETEAFGNLTLAGLDSIQVHRHLLNIIGQRLRRNRNSTLQLVGATAPGEPSQLAQERAKQVQEYLTSVWNVARQRMAIGTMEGQNIPEFSGVMLQTEDTALLAPIFWEWIVRRMAVPGIGIEQEMEADAGINDWRLTIRQQDRQLLHRSLRSDTLPPAASTLLTLRNLREREATEPLVATLRAIDSVGNEAIATDTLRVVVLAEHDTTEVTKVITTGTLFAAEYFPGVSEGNQQVLRYVLADLLPGNRVVVGEREVEVGSQVAKAIATAVGKSRTAGTAAQAVEKKSLTEEWIFSKSTGLRVEP